MQQTRNISNTSNAINRYFNKADRSSQQDTLGQIVVEILSEGFSLNRKSICSKLLSRLEQAKGPEEEEHYHTLLGLLFDR